MGSRLPQSASPTLTDASPAGLRAHWLALCADPLMASLPYKVETNLQGQIIMSPARARHSRIQGLIARLLPLHAQGIDEAGEILIECAVVTAEGVKVPDVAWSVRSQAETADQSGVFETAPAICIEVLSPSNTAEEMTGKTALYFRAGAREVWLCTEAGQMRFFAAAGELPVSALMPEFPLALDL